MLRYGRTVSLTLLLPAAAVIVSLSVLTFSMRAVERELIALRHSLRRSAVTAVAADDLARATVTMRQRAAEQAADAQARITRRPRWWTQQPTDAR